MYRFFVSFHGLVKARENSCKQYNKTQLNQYIPDTVYYIYSCVQLYDSFCNIAHFLAQTRIKVLFLWFFRYFNSNKYDFLQYLKFRNFCIYITPNINVKLFQRFIQIFVTTIILPTVSYLLKNTLIHKGNILDKVKQILFRKNIPLTRYFYAGVRK